MERQELKAKNPVVLQIAKQEQLKKKREKDSKTLQNKAKQNKAKQNMGAEVHEEVVC